MKKILFIILTMCVGLFLLRVPIIQEISPKVAKFYGLDVSDFEISQLNADKIVVPMLAMQHVDKSFQASIEIHDLIIDIDKYKAEVMAASSSHIYIDVELLEGEAATKSEQSVKEIIRLLPIFGINIERLELDYSTSDGELFHFDGELLYSQQATLKGMLAYRGAANVALNLSIDESDFSIDVLQEDAPLITMAGEYDVQDDWLNVRLAGDVSIAAINKFLLRYGADEYIQQDITTIKAKFEIDLARTTQTLMQSLAADMDLDSSLNFSFHQLDIKNAQVDVSANCHVERLESVSCAFKDPQHAAIEFYQTPKWLSKYFENVDLEYVVEINPSDQVIVQLSFKEILAANVKGNSAINLGSQSSQLKIDGFLSGLNFNGVYQDWQLATDYRLKLQGEKVVEPANISRLIMNAQGDVNADNEQITVNLNEHFNVSALDVNYQGYKTKKIHLKPVRDAEIIYRYQEGSINAEDIRLILSSKQFGKDSTEFNLAPIKLQIDSMDYSGVRQAISANMYIDDFVLRERGIPFTAYKLSADIDLSGNKLSIDGDMNLGEQKHRLNFSAKHDMSTGLGSGVLNAEAVALADNEIIASQIGQSGFPLQLKGGLVNVDADAIWNVNNSVPEVNIKFSADQVMGDYAQNQFSDLNVALEFYVQDGWRLAQAADINLGLVNVGVPLRNVSMRLDRLEYQVQEQPLIKLSDLYASALDGSIHSKQIEIDLNRRENQFSIFLSSLSLDKLIALNQTEDLAVSGTLDGELPMRLDDGVLLIDEGWLSANEDGGYIKYKRIGEVLVGNENLQLVGELLEDFQYNEMSAQVNLVPSGELTLTTKLHGRSPKAELNKQVNLNFNIDFNLWKFLESARLLTHIDQDVSEQILSNQKH